MPEGQMPERATALARTLDDADGPFRASPGLDTAAKQELNPRQRGKLDAFIDRYVARTPSSKAYAKTHRPHLADPRLVNGFRPLLKEIVYPIVVERSSGAHLWDLDGNRYVDASNGFGTSLLGWQPDFLLEALRRQLEAGGGIGPQHPLAGQVARLMCDITGHDRVSLCNTGSEAVLGALRLARAVTGRDTVVLFRGSCHGIVDEIPARGTRASGPVTAVQGILSNNAEHVMVLDYGTPETLQVIRERARELAAVIVEPVQAQRPDFQPIEFVRQLRDVTRDAGVALIFDETLAGLRLHPGGAQALFGVRADIAAYGEAIGGGYPIGAITGSREYMDAVDGGPWQFGDASAPGVEVAGLAASFARHPLALAGAAATLEHLKAAGPALQEGLDARTTAMVDELNAFCVAAGAPIRVTHFASLWKVRFLEEHPLQDLLFAMLRHRGVHVPDDSPCSLTAAHTHDDCRHIIEAFKASVIELQDMEFLPRRESRLMMDAAHPITAGARLGREPGGRPAWFVADPDRPGKFLKVGT